MDPTLTAGNPDLDAETTADGNPDLGTEGAASLVEDGTPNGEGEDGNEDTFTSSLDLPAELLPAYKSMQADYTRKMQALKAERREVDSTLAEAAKEREQLTQLVANLQARIDNPATVEPAKPAPAESASAGSRDALVRRFQQQVANAGDEGNHLDFFVELVEGLTELRGSGSSDREAGLLQTIEGLQQRLERAEQTLRPYQESATVNNDWWALVEDHPEFGDKRIESRVKDIIAADSDLQQALRSDNTAVRRMALRAAGESAIRQHTEGRLTKTAKRPKTPASNDGGDGKFSPAVGSAATMTMSDIVASLKNSSSAWAN